MIRNLEDTTVKVIELGKGTTHISQVYVGGDGISSGIVFSNHCDGKMHGDEIIIEITDFKGAAAYLKAVLELINTWKIEGTEKQIEKIIDSLNPLLAPGVSMNNTVN